MHLLQLSLFTIFFLVMCSSGEKFPLLINTISNHFCITAFLTLEISDLSGTGLREHFIHEQTEICTYSFDANNKGHFRNRKWIFFEVTECPCNMPSNENTTLSSPLLLRPTINSASTRFIALEISTQFRQSDLSQTFEHHTKLRDYHKQSKPRPSPLAPLFMMAQFLADKANGTLTTSLSASQMETDVIKFPTIIMNLQMYKLYSNGGMNSLRVRSTYGRTNKDKLYISLLAGAPFTFGYCAVPKMYLVKPWDLHVLLHGFDKSAWASLLVTTAALIAIFLSLEKGMSLSTTVFSLISPLISSTVNFKSETRQLRYLFSLWLFIIIVIVTCYTGENASFVILPPEEEIMEGLTDAVANNYSILFRDPLFHSLLKEYNKMRQRVVRKNPQYDVVALSHLINKWERDDSRYIGLMTDYIEAFVLREKVVILTVWFYLFENIQNANKLLHDKLKVQNRRCYHGSRLFPALEIYDVLVPPGNYELFKAKQARDFSGITEYWSNEYFGLHVARRVQDRVKVISPTKAVDDFDTFPTSLRLDGKVACIFFMFVGGLDIGIMVVLIEWLWCNSTSNV